MRFPPGLPNTTAQIYHLASTAGQSQAYTLGATVNAACLPLDSKQLAIEGVSAVEGWELYLDVNTDIRLNDKIVVGNDTANYFVSKIFEADFGTLQHKRVSIVKQV